MASKAKGKFAGKQLERTTLSDPTCLQPAQIRFLVAAWNREAFQNLLSCKKEYIHATLSKEGDSMMQSRTARLVGRSVKLSALLLAGLTLTGQSNVSNISSLKFPSREAICAPVYGAYEAGSVPYCSVRFGQCLKAEGDAIDRLSQAWAAVPKKVRQKCLDEARSRRTAIYQTYPIVLATARDQGYEGSYSVSAVETCIAVALKKAMPPKIEALPASCLPSSELTLPPEETQTPEEQCASANSFADPEAQAACVKAEALAKGRITKIKPMLTANIVASCKRLITAKGFEGSALPYRSSSFLDCATKAIKYRNLTE